MPSLSNIDRARAHCVGVDWKLQDMVIVLTAEIPEEFVPGLATTDGER